jgi:uncharacterized delta-60 repeat protein
MIRNYWLPWVVAAAMGGIAHADGIVILDGGSSEADYVKQGPRIGADGRIHVLLGTSTNSCASRAAALDANGNLVAGFGQGGTRSLGNFCVIDLAVTAQGNYLLRADVVQRTDAQLDPVWTSPSYLATLPHGVTGGASHTGFTLQPDGKVIAAGIYTPTSMGGPTYDWVFARLTPDGSALDPTFNTGAVLQQHLSNSSGFFTEVDSLHVLANGQVLSSGRIQTDTSANTYSTLLSRYNSNGTIDFTFGANSELALADSIGKSVIDSSGRVYLVAATGHVTRLTAGYSIDGTYAGGAVNTLVKIADLALDSTGRVVIFGKLSAAGGDHAYVARFDSSGNPDSTFNGTGVVDYALPLGVTSNCHGALQADDKTVLACDVNDLADAGATAPINFAVLRFTTAGVLDTTFGATQVDTDQYPDAFTFGTTSVAYGTVDVIAGPITVSGINTPAPLSVAGASYSVGCTGNWVDTSSGLAASISVGQSLCLRRNAPTTPGATATTTVNIGGRIGTFVLVSSTTPADIIPDAFAFSSRANVAPNVQVESSPVTVSGITGRSPVSVVNGSYSVGCTGSYVGQNVSQTIANGQTICVSHLSASASNTAVTTTLTIGGIQGSFTSTTFAFDSTPDAFTFTDQTGVAQGAVIQSNVITVTGINVPTPISITGGGYGIGCVEPFTSDPGTVVNGDIVCVGHGAANTPGATVRTTLTIGGVSDEFSSTTFLPDTTPDAFTFTDRTGVAKNTDVTSNSITVSGINTDTPMTITGGQYSVGCNGTFSSAPGTVVNGQTVCVRHATSTSNDATVTTILTIGSVSASFSSTTAAGSGGGYSSGGGGGGGAFDWLSVLALLAVLGYSLGLRRGNVRRSRTLHV